MNTLDLNTLHLSSMMILIVLSVLFVLIWLQHKEQDANKYWALFTILLTIDAIASYFPGLCNHYLLSHTFNFLMTFANLFLMMGFCKFAKLKINKNFLIFLFSSCFIITMLGAIFEYSILLKLSIEILYNSIAITISMYAIVKLARYTYFIEKYFLLFLLSVQLVLQAYWILIVLRSPNNFSEKLSNAVMPVYFILILVIIALLLLVLGKIRHNLENHNLKSIAIKNELSNIVRETNFTNKSKSIFLTNMSHELRTPLNIILGFSDALKLEITGPLNDKQKTIIGDIHFSGLRLLTLINDLLSLSSIEAGSLDKEFRKVKPINFIEDHIEDLRDTADRYRVSFKYIDDLAEIDPDLYLFINQDWVHQLLMALIDNASKYGAKDGTIWLNAFLLDNETIRISIKDEGAGVANSERGEIFKPFHRAVMDSNAVEGAGAGLAIVKGLVKAMNATIDFESRKGAGTTFWIDFPLFKD